MTSLIPCIVINIAEYDVIIIAPNFFPTYGEIPGVANITTYSVFHIFSIFSQTVCPYIAYLNIPTNGVFPIVPVAPTFRCVPFGTQYSHTRYVPYGSQCSHTRCIPYMVINITMHTRCVPYGSKYSRTLCVPYDSQYPHTRCVTYGSQYFHTQCEFPMVPNIPNQRFGTLPRTLEWRECKNDCK
jgi:hypothetical protein